MRKQYFEFVEELLQELEETQGRAMSQAAKLVAESIMSGGILQAFGSGHSYASAIEICGRAGGLIPAKAIKEPAQGMYEMVEGVGTVFAKKLDVRSNDVVVIISNSGRNPLPIEIAEKCKLEGAKIIVVTSLVASENLTSRHSNGKHLYDYGDVILDNCVPEGDSSLAIPGVPVKVCGTSSLAAVALLQQVVFEAIELMVSKGYIPPVWMSYNIDGGYEFNDRILEQYNDRLNRI